MVKPARRAEPRVLGREPSRLADPGGPRFERSLEGHRLRHADRIVIDDGDGRKEAVADGVDGPPGFREKEVAKVLARFAEAGQSRIVFLTADVHYAAAHRYRWPFTFWEFVAGPLHAGQFGPGVLDPTFQPILEYSNREPGAPFNVPPSPDASTFGIVSVEPRTRDMTVALQTVGGRTLYEVTLRGASTKVRF
ncbi:MAG: hypothetical protein HC923_00060 [Myxococcales bacterium]|nr:hypothetical protein [Myxococcales bacterium]